MIEISAVGFVVVLVLVCVFGFCFGAIVSWVILR